MGESNIDKVDKSNWVPAGDASERGYYGYTPDDTPNEAYTVAGVTGDEGGKADEPRRVAPKAK